VEGVGGVYTTWEIKVINKLGVALKSVRNLLIVSAT